MFTDCKDMQVLAYLPYFEKSVMYGIKSTRSYLDTVCLFIINSKVFSMTLFGQSK